jgi:hypothetical protein
VGWVVTIRVLLFIFASRSFQILENKRATGWLAGSIFGTGGTLISI